MFVDRKTQCCQLSFLLSLIYKISAIPIKAQQVTHTDHVVCKQRPFHGFLLNACTVYFFSFPYCISGTSRKMSKRRVMTEDMSLNLAGQL